MPRIKPGPAALHSMHSICTTSSARPFPLPAFYTHPDHPASTQQKEISLKSLIIGTCLAYTITAGPPILPWLPGSLC